MIVLPLMVLALSGGALAKPLELAYGVNKVDINADGVEDMIVRVRWDILNAYASDSYLIAVTLPEHNDLSPIVYEVKYMNDTRKDFDELETADCMLTAYRFALDKQGWLVVKVYDHDWNTRFDEVPIKVTTYKLRDRDTVDDLPYGYTPFLLQKVGERLTKGKYCDVRDAMKGE